MKLNKLPLNVIGLNRVGLNQIGSPSRRADTSDRPYIDPEVLASLVAVCICDGKSNDDPDRAVIKNLVDPDNPFIISNAAFKLNSGYGKYEVDFTSWSRLIGVKAFSNKFVIENKAFNCAYYVRDTGEDLDEFKAKINNHTDGIIRYTYINQDGIVANLDISPDDSNRVFTFPKSYNSIEGVANHICGFQTPMFVNTGIIIEQIPSHQGAFVTDGIDDLITSTKTVQEMLDDSKELTVVSMTACLSSYHPSNNTAFTNYIRNDQEFIRSYVTNANDSKYGIYGYSISNIDSYNTTAKVINNILGDKEDYKTVNSVGTNPEIWNNNFSVVGYLANNDNIVETSQLAWYWTFIANKALTTDQINQVISYFNLDKHVKPDVYYDVKKQGLSNDTPEADWYLKDFSGNGHDMTLYNFAKKLGSGIGKYEVDFNTWTPQSYVADSTYTSNKLHITNIKGGNAILYTKKGANAMKVKITGIQSFNLVYRYIAENDVWEALEVDRDGIYELPASTTTTKTYYTGFTVPYYTGDCDITIEQIHDYEGALVSDGIDDYGKVENLPIYKDYTVVAEYSRIRLDSCILSKSKISSVGSFIFNMVNTSYSYTAPTDDLAPNDASMQVKYQSKYINQGRNINAGAQPDSDSMWLGVVRDNDTRFSSLAVRSILVYPYSLSPLLIERQLKRYKLGTLYPDMVEWRPIISSNIPYDKIEFFDEQWTKRIYPGDYVEIGATIKANLYLNNYDISTITSLTSSQFESVYIDRKGQYYDVVLSGIKKSPQKINITIDEYIRYEDIVQPYPAIINLKQDGKTITWGDKLKVGSDIVFVGSANLLPELYTVSDTRYNGVTLYPNTIIKVEKSMVFDNARTYLKANEPSCILSPNRLRIPNSSYKILGYIPDLTGKGNHGVINNSAYAGMSGANGYKYDWNTYTSYIAGVKPTYNAFKVNLTAETSTTALFSTPIFTVGSKSHYFRFKISGLINNQKIQIDYPKGSDDTVIFSDRFGNGEYSTKDYTVGEFRRLDFYVINAVKGEPISVSIEQLPEYESSFCLDGVDDFVTIPTLAHGAKQVLMKVNLQSYDRYLYDQRNSWSQYLAIVSAGKTIAYEYSNKGGKTYIDGILNEHIIDKDLLNITHNITAANANIGVQYAPNIGTSFARGNFAQMALFDFMLFPEISSEDEIKELNDVMGIENNIEVS